MKLKRSKLRDLLTNITNAEVPEHRSLLQNLNQKMQHDICDNHLDPERDVLLDEFNCFEYAFDLSLSSVYRAALDFQHGWKINPVGADHRFVQYLLDNSELAELAASDSDISCIVIYFNGVAPTHAGKFINDRVHSKWGLRGLLLEHNLDEVPSSYGDEARIYERLPVDDCIDAFARFAVPNGIEYAANMWRRSP